MSDDNQSNNNARGPPFSHGFSFGNTLQNVFRNINQAFASGSGHQGNGDSRDHAGDVPPLTPVGTLRGAHSTHPTGAASTPLPNPSASSASALAHVDVPSHSHPDSHHEDDGDSMPDLRSVSDSSDESDTGIATFDPTMPHQGVRPVDDDHDGTWTDAEGDPPFEPITGTRRTRVDDDGDDARDRRHPSERVGVAPPPDDAPPQGAHPQQMPRPPAGLFGALFGMGPPGANFPGGEAPPEHAETGEDAADPSPTGNNATPGRAPRGVPILTAGFTFTIPLFGPPPGNRAGPPPTAGQGGFPGLFGMDAAAREELFTSFAAFLQEFQAMDEAREDPERAKKLVAGLEVVPLGLVKRLERVGGAPGSYAGDVNAEGSSSGCAICWDTLLDTESDSFGGQQFSQGDGQDEIHAEHEAMNVDAPPAATAHSEGGTSTSNPPSAEAPKIISLPCAHVFHASCLLPWFTRAKQATCPTCRFNIDPENLTYTPPLRRAFSRAPRAQPDDAVPNPVPVGPQATPDVPPANGARGADDEAIPVDPATAADEPAPPPPAGTAEPGPNPFVPISGIPVLSFPAIQIPLRAAGAAPGGNNRGMSSLFPAPHPRPVPLPSSTNGYILANTGIDVLTIGVDMFVGGLPPEQRDDEPRDNPEGVDGAHDGGASTGPAGGDGAANPNPNGMAQDLHSWIEGFLRTARNIVPQTANAQGAAPAPNPAADVPPAEGAEPQPQPQARPMPEAGPEPLPTGGVRGIPIFPFHPMFRPTRPMPPRRERKTWALPPAPGLSLRQRVEQREREQGLRCSDTSCGIGPSDDDPFPESSSPLTKQVSIHPLSDGDISQCDFHTSVCTHAFHPSCLVSAERVAGWGGEDKAELLIEVSCPVCRAVGCVTREEWESGVTAFS